MTSEERRENRYRRRVEKRAKNKTEKCAQYDDFDTVFSYAHLYSSYKQSRKNVSWKASVQKFITNAPRDIFLLHKSLEKGKYKNPGYYEFFVYERGKKRHIKSSNIHDRIVQRTFCDYCLNPMLFRTFVYDNGSATPGKGYSFAVRRITAQLQKHYRKYGQEGYILLYDFSKFFDSVSHEIIKKMLRKEFTDERILRLADQIIDEFGDVGLGMGSHVSQVLSLASANRLDHYVKEVLRIKGYGRYMDDGYLIHPSKEYLQKCLEQMKIICYELGITLNLKKTQIVKLSHGFKWLKIRFYLTETGKVVKKIYKRSITKMRRKLKKLNKLWREKKISFSDIYLSWQSWKSYASKFSSFYTIKNMEELYNKLFFSEWEDYIYALS